MIIKLRVDIGDILFLAVLVSGDIGASCFKECQVIGKKKKKNVAEEMLEEQMHLLFLFFPS